MASNYGSMYIANASANLISGTLTAGTELQVSGYSAMENSGWTVSSNRLSAGSGAAGKYMFRFSLSFSATVGLWNIIVYNNSTAETQILGKRKIGSSDVGNVAITGLINIAAYDVITIYVKSDADATDFTPIHSQVTLIPIVSAASPYVGEMTIDGGSTSQSLSTSWADLTGFSDNNNNNGFTFSSNTLTNPSDGSGYYYVSLSVSLKTTTGSGASNYEFGIATNGGSPSTMLMKRYLSGSADRGNTVLCGIIQLNNSDVIHVQAKNSASKDIVVQYANLIISSLDISSTSYYGNMYMTNNTSYITVNNNSWTQDPNFSAATNNSGWSVSSGKLVPSSSAFGFYLISFNCAITYKDAEDIGSYIYPLAGIFINGTQQTNLSFERKLQKKDNYDYGSISGSGFVRISSISDAIELKYKSDGSGDKKILTKDANLNLIQLSTEKALPIILSSFGVLKEDGFNQLKWTTASEENSSIFEVQSSLDGKNFNIIGRKQAAGNSNTLKNYSFTDANPINGNIYYRLKQVDYDGEFTYSKIITVNNFDDEFSFNKVYFNESTLYLNLNNTQNSNAKVEIIDITGRIINTYNLQLIKNQNNYNLFIGNNLKGVYFIRIKMETTTVLKKVVI